MVRETCDYVLRDLTDPAGGFYSTEDADSEGEEGKFYVWTPEEIQSMLGRRGRGNFLLRLRRDRAGQFRGAQHSQFAQIDRDVRQNQAARSRPNCEPNWPLAERNCWKCAGRRVRPGRDDKVLVAWNGLMIDALARAAGALDEPRYLAAAAKAADFILSDMRRPDGRLLHTWRAGQAKYDAYLDDYAALANALVSLYEATFDERYIDEAVRLVEIMLAHFVDPAGGGFFYTADDHEQLIARHKDIQDSSVPSGNALAATVLVHLAKLTGRTEYLSAAEKTFRMAIGLLERAPSAAGQMLLALDMVLGPTAEMVLLGDPATADMAAVLRALRRKFIPNKVVAMRSGTALLSDVRSKSLNPLFAGKTSQAGEPALYICENFACQSPVNGRDAAIAKIAALAGDQ